MQPCGCWPTEKRSNRVETMPALPARCGFISLFVGPDSAGSERAQITLDGLLARGWEVKLVSASDGYQEDLWPYFLEDMGLVRAISQDKENPRQSRE